MDAAIVTVWAGGYLSIVFLSICLGEKSIDRPRWKKGWPGVLSSVSVRPGP